MKKRLKKKQYEKAWYRHARILSFMLNRPLNSFMPTGRWSRHEAKAWWGMCKLMSGRRTHNLIFDEHFTEKENEL